MAPDAPVLHILDHGRLTVAAADRPLLERHGLTAFDDFLRELPGERGVKAHRIERGTSRFELTDEHGEARGFYIKRHGRASLWEQVKPLLRGQPATFGAEPEWRAMLGFHEAGVPCAKPVAMGEGGARSLVVTAELVGVKLSRLLATWPPGGERLVPPRALLNEVADLAARMHGAGLHHQDFYLSHLMQVEAGESKVVHVLDLGRARRVTGRLSRRWIVKDLAQLLHSAKAVRRMDRLRFLRRYLGGRLLPEHRPLIRAVERKAAAIARHDTKRRRRRARRGGARCGGDADV